MDNKPLLLACLLSSVACTADPSLDSMQARLAGEEAELGTFSAALSVSDDRGAPVELDEATTEVFVEVRSRSDQEAPWKPLESVDLDFQGPSRLDVVVVADNSGSEAGKLINMQEGIGGLAKRVMTRSQLDRVGLVRVSTQSSKLQALTNDSSLFDAALDELFITNGWTALWDGVRMASELLAEAEPVLTPRGERARLCMDRTHRAIVAFTDGQENNSSDEHQTRYPGDGIDTTFQDLVALHVDGSHVPVHWVGVGDQVDAATLEAMADQTGARYVEIAHVGSLQGALESTAARLTSQVPICFQLDACGAVETRLTVTFEHDGAVHVRHLPRWVDLDCDCSQVNQPRCDVVGSYHEWETP